MENLLLPGDPLFDRVLSTPLGWIQNQYSNGIGEQCAMVADAETGILRPASPEELDDYLWGGEYDERMENLGEEEDDACIYPYG